MLVTRKERDSPVHPRRNRDAAKDRICLLLEHGGIEIDKQERRYFKESSVKWREANKMSLRMLGQEGKGIG